MELDRETTADLDISSEAEVLSYTHGSTTREVVARANLGDSSAGIVGGGTYTLNFYINDVPVSPSSDVDVAPGVTRTIMVSRTIPLDPDDEVSIKVVGLGGDTSVNVVATLRDVTPITTSDVEGAGSVVVDHDYGGLDALSYKTSDGAGIDNANISAYLTSDYEAGNRSNEFVIARTTTNVLGRWVRALMLDPGDYTLVYHAQSRYGVDLANITVE